MRRHDIAPKDSTGRVPEHEVWPSTQYRSVGMGHSEVQSESWKTEPAATDSYGNSAKGDGELEPRDVPAWAHTC